MTSPSKRSPFVGLRSFEMTDHDWFRGRDQEIATLLHKVRNNKFTAVVGASGSGKSSLVRAGILPHLDQEGWKSIVVKPGSAPIAKLASTLSESAREDSIDALANARGYHYDTALRQSAYGLAEITDQLAPDAPKLLLLVDQFEELFRYGEEAQGLRKAAMEEESHAFVELLLTATAQSTSRLHVVITMRSDFFSNCATYPGLAEAVSASQYLVPLPSRDQLEAIIRGPVTDAGGHIDNLLVQRLLLDVTQQTDLLPTLQHTLRRLWEAAPEDPKQLRDEDYQAIGGIKGSIHVKAEQLTDKLKQSHADDLLTLEKLLKAITLLDEQNRATRRPQQYGALLGLITEVRGESTFAKVLGTSTRAKASLDRVLDTLAGEDISFIQKGTGEDPEIDISHEALIRSWQRLCGDKRDFKSGWLFEEREDGRQWWDLVRRAEKNRWLTLHDIRNTRKWIKQNKIGEQWCQRYGDSWSDVRTFHHESLFFGSTSWVFAGLIMAVVGIIAAYQENLQQAMEIQYQQAEVLRQQKETLHQARAGALAAAALSHSYANDGNARLGALIALNVTPESRSIDDPRYVHEIGVALVNALTRPIEIMRHKHQNAVLSAAFSPDGNRIVSASEDNMLRLWDVQSGKLIGEPLIGHQSLIRSAAFSPDGSHIVSASFDKTLRLWDAHSGKPIGEPLQGHQDKVSSVAFSSDSNLIVSASFDKTLRLWDAHSGKPIGEPLQGHQDRVRSAAFSPNGNRIVSASDDMTLRLWDAHSGKPIGEPLQGHQGRVISVAFSPDGKRIASAGEDNMLHLWDAQSGNPLSEPLQGHQDGIRSIAFSPDSKHIVSASNDMTLRLWDAQSGKPIGEPLQGHQGWVMSVAFSPDGNRIVSASFDKTMRLWDVQPAKSIDEPLQGHQDWVISATFSPDGKLIVSASLDKTLRLWNAQSGKPIGEPLQGHQGRITSVAFSPDGKHIVSTSEDKTLRLWDVYSGKSIGKPLQGHQDVVFSAAFLPDDGKRIVSASWDDTLRLWDVESGEPIGEPLRGHLDDVWSVAFSPDSKLIVSASSDKTLRLWDAHSGKSIGEPLRGHQDKISSVAFSSDSNLIVSASFDKTLRLWDVRSGKPIGQPLHGHQDEVSGVAFSSDNNFIVSASFDKTLRLWDVRSGKPIGQPLHGHQDKVSSIAFSPDSKHIVSASFDKTLRLWNAGMFMRSLKELTEQTEKLCPLSEAERRQLGLYDPQAAASAKPLTPEQRQACGEDVYP